MVSAFICESLLLHNAASSVLLALRSCTCCSINRQAYFQKKNTLCNNFIQKMGVVLFLKVGIPYIGKIGGIFRRLHWVNAFSCCQGAGLVAANVSLIITLTHCCMVCSIISMFWMPQKKNFIESATICLKYAV